MRNLILGVDPGLSGALALYDHEKSMIHSIYDMPVRPQGDKTTVDHEQLASILDIYSNRISFALIEYVHAMSKQGVSSTFKFGYGFGVVTGVIASHHIPIHFSPASVWKSQMGVTSVKASSIEKIKTLQPDSKEYFTLKKHDGRAEAALLAVFGAIILKGKSA